MDHILVVDVRHALQHLEEKSREPSLREMLLASARLQVASEAGVADFHAEEADAGIQVGVQQPNNVAMLTCGLPSDRLLDRPATKSPVALAVHRSPSKVENLHCSRSTIYLLCGCPHLRKATLPELLSKQVVRKEAVFIRAS